MAPAAPNDLGALRGSARGAARLADALERRSRTRRAPDWRLIGPSVGLLVAVAALLFLSQPHRSPALATAANATPAATGAVSPLAPGDSQVSDTSEPPATLLTPTTAPATSAPALPAATPMTASIGEAVRVVDTGSSLGTVTVVETDPFTVGQTERVEIRVRYVAGASSWALDPDAWGGMSTDGSTFTGYAGGRNPTLRAVTLAAHVSLDGWFEMDFPTAAHDPLLTYAASDGTVLFMVPLP